MGYLLGGTAKYFHNKNKIRKANALAKKKRIQAEKAERVNQFRKGTTPWNQRAGASHFDVKPNLPTHGSNKKLTIKRRLKQRFRK